MASITLCLHSAVIASPPTGPRPRQPSERRTLTFVIVLLCILVYLYMCVKSRALSDWLGEPPALFTNTNGADKAERSTKSLWASWKAWKCLLFDSVKPGGRGIKVVLLHRWCTGTRLCIVIQSIKGLKFEDTALLIAQTLELELFHFFSYQHIYNSDEWSVWVETWHNCWYFSLMLNFVPLVEEIILSLLND